MDAKGSEAGIMLIDSTEFWTWLLFLNTTLPGEEEVEAHLIHMKRQLLDIKIRQGHHKERKVQVSIPIKHGHKNPYENISKLNPILICKKPGAFS